MNRYSIFVIFSFFIVYGSLNIPSVGASPTIAIYTDKETYAFGDYLSFTIEVSKVTGEYAVLHITDEFGKTSSPINIPITQSKSTLTSPFPFEPTVYMEGKYTVDVKYADSTASTEFNLINSGKIVIPFWIRDFANYWFDEEISDVEFAKGIEYLIKNDIIVVPQTENQQYDKIKIPNWVKTSTKWWIDGKISDETFALGLQYLITVGVIVI